eukprot:Skav221248  [mRNA]  locus=scaffold1045:464025:483429:+ [translate_table: standard]
MKCRPSVGQLATVAVLLKLGLATKAKQRGIDAAFQDFMARHGRSYELNSQEYLERRELFAQRKTEVFQQNNRSSRWTAGLNKFADFKPEELKALHGYKPSQVRDSGLSLMQEEESHANLKVALPDEVDWRHLKDAAEIVDQGSCGSCWAISATTVLNAHSEIHRKLPKRFSTQEMICLWIDGLPSASQQQRRAPGTCVGGARGSTTTVASSTPATTS